LKAAQINRELVQTQVEKEEQPNEALDLAEVELEVAEADLDLAELEFDNTSIRAPFAGEIISIDAVEGSFVTSGDLLMTLRDSKKLMARVPVNREDVKQGDSIEVTLDVGSAQANVQTILPLNNDWQALREILDTAAIAVVVLDNTNGKYHDGQTVYSPVVPRQPVIEIANTALKNSETGRRIVQVIRDSLVRDIEVQVLGPVGEGRSYVAGALQANDDVITEVSEPLVDGTVVRPANETPPQQENVPKLDPIFLD